MQSEASHFMIEDNDDLKVNGKIKLTNVPEAKPLLGFGNNLNLHNIGIEKSQSELPHKFFPIHIP